MSSEESNSTVRVRSTSIPAYSVLIMASSLVIPTAYVLGRTFIESWILANGLSVAVFPIAVDEALFGSYIASLHGATLALDRWAPFISSTPVVALWLFTILALFGLAILYSAVSEIISHSIGRRLSRAPRTIKRNRYARDFIWAYLVASAPVLFIGLVLYIVFISLVPAVMGEKLGYSAGKEFRKELLERINSGEYSGKDRFVILKNDSSSVKHVVIKCGAHGCGLVSKNGAIFVTWDRVEQIY